MVTLNAARAAPAPQIFLVRFSKTSSPTTGPPKIFVAQPLRHGRAGMIRKLAPAIRLMRLSAWPAPARLTLRR